MRSFILMVVCLAACVPAQAAEPAGPGPAATARPQMPAPEPQRAAKPSPFTDPDRKPPAASIAVTVTDDADSTRLPPFATPSTPQPKKLFRVGVEWSF
ncbi:MAG TPA: hypothetical protein VKE95_17615 [Burkholderiales bacterium]|nr:hypothetical protein [Burkholderiales bacterium]